MSVACGGGGGGILKEANMNEYGEYSLGFEIWRTGLGP